MTPSDAGLPIEIDCRAVRAARDGGDDLLLVDCREPDEYALVRIDGAVLIPMGEFPQRVAEFAGHRDARIVIHCHHGGRSLRAANWLRQNGFPQAQSMAGGIDAWAIEVDTALQRY